MIEIRNREGKLVCTGDGAFEREMKITVLDPLQFKAAKTKNNSIMFSPKHGCKIPFNFGLNLFLWEDYTIEFVT